VQAESARLAVNFLAGEALYDDQPRILSVYDGRRAIGFLIQRGRSGVEAFDADGASIGLFSNQREAAAAVTAASDRGPQ
jgi:hypothetical protein